jgi:hypothetical protein
MRYCVVLLFAGALRADWIIEQKDYGNQPQRVVIGAWAYRLHTGEWDLVADFSQKIVWRSNREMKTVEKIGLEEYLTHPGAGGRPYQETPSGAGTFAGIACEKYSYTYNDGTVGGWGSGESCYARSITMPEPYRKLFARWLKVSQGSSGEYGLRLWMKNAVDGPPRVNLETVRVEKKSVAADEFRVPGEYTKIPFKW